MKEYSRTSSTPSEGDHYSIVIQMKIKRLSDTEAVIYLHQRGMGNKLKPTR